jgi:putative membrane protein
MKKRPSVSYREDRHGTEFHVAVEFPSPNAFSGQQMVELVKSTTVFPARSDANVTLSVDRTRLSYDRTLMSWIRTATSLITFGFTIYKFFQIESDRMVAASSRLIGPREFSLMMIAIGLTSLLVATIEHSRDLSALKAQFPQARFPRSTARFMAGLISLLGVCAIATILLRQ